MSNQLVSTLGWSLIHAARNAQAARRRVTLDSLKMIDIDRPTIDWVAMAKSMGVPGSRVNTAEDFYAAMVRSADESRPSLIEVKLY